VARRSVHPTSCRWSISSRLLVAGVALGTFTSTRRRSWRRSPARSRTACGSVATSCRRARSGVRAAAGSGSIEIGGTVTARQGLIEMSVITTEHEELVSRLLDPVVSERNAP
jgi:hypothetical protein